MLRVAMDRIQSKLRYSWVAFQLLPETFTLPELRAVYAAILDPSLLRLNTSNFKKAFAALFASGALVPVGRRAAVGRVGRPADFVGDSLALSRQAAATDAAVIVFCGVHFMAETAKILSPEKTVLIPDLDAGCSLADTITADDLRAWKAEYPGAVVVAYVNTSA